MIFTRYLLLQPMGSAAQSAKACPLRMTDDTVLAAAERTGFKNLSHYNRGFKARFGLTSREFRRRSHTQGCRVCLPEKQSRVPNCCTRFPSGQFDKSGTMCIMKMKAVDLLQWTACIRSNDKALYHVWQSA